VGTDIHGSVWRPFANGPRRRAPLVGQGCSCHACRCIPGRPPPLQEGGGQGPVFRVVFPPGPWLRQSKIAVVSGRGTHTRAPSYLHYVDTRSWV
jgi:hypothetical protein